MTETVDGYKVRAGQMIGRASARAETTYQPSVALEDAHARSLVVHDVDLALAVDGHTFRTLKIQRTFKKSRAMRQFVTRVKLPNNFPMPNLDENLPFGSKTDTQRFS